MRVVVRQGFYCILLKRNASMWEGRKEDDHCREEELGRVYLRLGEHIRETEGGRQLRRFTLVFFIHIATPLAFFAMHSMKLLR